MTKTTKIDDQEIEEIVFLPPVTKDMYKSGNQQCPKCGEKWIVKTERKHAYRCGYNSQGSPCKKAM